MRKITLSICLIGAMVFGLQAQNVQPAQDNILDLNSTERPQWDPNTVLPSTVGTPEDDVIYDNGPHINVPGNPNLSLLEAVALGANTLGINVSNDLGYGAADDFTLDSTYKIDFIDVYSYQTGANGSSITAVYMQIWDGNPAAGGGVIWGDMFTNIIYDVEEGDDFRVSENSPNDRTRSIQTVTGEIGGITLEAGTYWLEVSLDGSVNSGPWMAPIVILGEMATGDALQKIPDGWQDFVDTGNLAPQGIPFKIYGSEILSVNDNALSSFSFYPNPTLDVLNISAGKNIDSVSLYNVLGQEVLSTKVEATSSNISLAGLSAGTYMMKVTINGQVGTYKVVKI